MYKIIKTNKLNSGEMFILNCKKIIIKISLVTGFLILIFTLCSRKGGQIELAEIRFSLDLKEENLLRGQCSQIRTVSKTNLTFSGLEVLKLSNESLYSGNIYFVFATFIRKDNNNVIEINAKNSKEDFPKMKHPCVPLYNYILYIL